MPAFGVSESSAVMDITTIFAELDRYWIVVQNELIGFVQPWRLYQIAILIGLFAAAHFADRRLEPRMNEWIRGLENASKARLRLLVIISRHIRSLCFISSAWLVVLILRVSTWPSRSYIIALVASLVTGWIVVSISSRVLRNRLLRTSVTWSAWAVVTIYIFGLTDKTAEVLDGVALNLGEVHISLLLILKAAVVLAVLLTIANWSSALLQRRIEGIEDISPSMKVLTAKLFRLFVYGVALMVGLQSIGFDLTSLTIFSGAVGLGLGFGLQKIVSNLVSGLILLVDKSIKPGDVISLGETFGWIGELGARYVSVVTRDGREYLIPNEDLITNQVVNWSHSSELVRLDIYFGVSYQADPHQVRKFAAEAAGTVARVVANPAPVCHIVGFGDSSVDFILRFWIRDPTAGLTNVRGAVYLALWDALKVAGVEIPYPRRDITIRQAAISD